MLGVDIVEEQDITGKRFGRWLVIKKDISKKLYWICKCDCGTIKSVYGSNLRLGKTKSCGCLLRETSSRIHKTHGKYHNPIYSVWAGMLRRCKNKNDSHYHFYGGRGIKVCNRWEKFINFYEDMSDGYKKGLQIDRIDTNGNYEPGNCRWVTPKQNSQNRNSNVFITMNGKRMVQIEWARHLKVHQTTMSLFCKKHREDSDILIEGGSFDNTDTHKELIKEIARVTNG